MQPVRDERRADRADICLKCRCKTVERVSNALDVAQTCAVSCFRNQHFVYNVPHALFNDRVTARVFFDCRKQRLTAQLAQRGHVFLHRDLQRHIKRPQHCQRRRVAIAIAAAKRESADFVIQDRRDNVLRARFRVRKFRKRLEHTFAGQIVGNDETSVLARPRLIDFDRDVSRFQNQRFSESRFFITIHNSRTARSCISVRSRLSVLSK